MRKEKGHLERLRTFLKFLSCKQIWGRKKEKLSSCCEATSDTFGFPLTTRNKQANGNVKLFNSPYFSVGSGGYLVQGKIP